MSFLERLAGTWHAEETLHASPWNPVARTVDATLLARLTMGGNALVMEHRRESYEGLGVLLHGYELWWFDAFEPPGPAKGRGAGDRLVLDRDGPLGRARYTYAFEGDDEFTFRIERMTDGKEWKGYLDARYVRAPPPPLPS